VICGEPEACAMTRDAAMEWPFVSGTEGAAAVGAWGCGG
jgi:hypothetical protein